jgi:hypothetical protein
MALITRRYLYNGPWPLDLKNALGAGTALPPPFFAITYDLQYDDVATDVAAVDERMRHYGCFPDTQNTSIASPTPFLGVKSPDGSVWKLDVSDLGILTVVKVSV